MQVFYKKTISDQILDLQAEAVTQGKEIEKIIFTQKEWAQLKWELRSLACPNKPSTVFGVNFDVEEDSRITATEIINNALNILNCDFNANSILKPHINPKADDIKQKFKNIIEDKKAPWLELDQYISEVLTDLAEFFYDHIEKNLNANNTPNS